MDQCVFCEIVAGRAPSEQVYADEHTVVFLDINPVLEGHTLVAPRRHMEDLFGLTDEEAGPFMAAVRRVAERLIDGLGADGVNLFQANGAAAFQTVFHLHMHVLPRRHGDGLVLPLGDRGVSGRPLAQVASILRGVE